MADSHYSFGHFRCGANNADDVLIISLPNGGILIFALKDELSKIYPQCSYDLRNGSAAVGLTVIIIRW